MKRSNRQGLQISVAETNELLGNNCGFQLFTLHHWQAIADGAPCETLPNTTFVFKLCNW